MKIWFVIHRILTKFTVFTLKYFLLYGVYYVSKVLMCSSILSLIHILFLVGSLSLKAIILVPSLLYPWKILQVSCSNWLLTMMSHCTQCKLYSSVAELSTLVYNKIINGAICYWNHIDVINLVCGPFTTVIMLRANR